MRKQITVLFLMVAFISCGIVFSSSAEAGGYKKIKVIGSVESRQTKKASSKKQRLALEDARKKALDKYIGGLDSQRVRILNNIKEQLYTKLNEFVPEVIPTGDGYWDSGYWNVDAMASVNAQIEELLNKYIQTNIKRRGEESYLTFVFVARESDAITKFDSEKTEKISENQQEQAGLANRDEKFEGTHQSTEEGDRVANETKKSTIKDSARTQEKTTSGFTIKRNDKIKYMSYISEDIDNKVTEIFNKADFAVVVPLEAGIGTKSFLNDYVNNDELSAGSKQAAIESARAKGIRYLAVGTLDVGEQIVDQATGMQKAYVRVNAFIIDTQGKFSTKVCSIGPVQYSGTGEDPRAAKTNALITAGTEAAKDLVDQLRVKQGL